MLSLEEVFPPFALRISCGAVTLSVLRDDDLPELVELVRAGIQVPGLPMPFLADWHEEPFAPGSPDGFPTTSLRWWWTQRATCAPDEWRIALAVRRDGVIVGMQDMHATDFPQTRQVETGSWLGRAHQGAGTGTLMRQLVVGFGRLRSVARWATSTTGGIASCSARSRARSESMSSASSSRRRPTSARTSRSRSRAPIGCAGSWGSEVRHEGLYMTSTFAVSPISDIMSLGSGRRTGIRCRALPQQPHSDSNIGPSICGISCGSVAVRLAM